jgi:hypothetical protein
MTRRDSEPPVLDFRPPKDKRPEIDRRRVLKGALVASVMTPGLFTPAHAANPPFGSRPYSPPLSFSGQPVVVRNKTFKNAGPNTDYIDMSDCHQGLMITDCDFDTMDPNGTGLRAIYGLNCTGPITFRNLRFKQPAHNAMQFDKCHVVGDVYLIYVRGPTALTEDVVSVFQSGGMDANNRLRLHDIHIDGRNPDTGMLDWISDSGTGIIAVDSAQDINTGFVDIFRNTLLACAQDAIGVPGGHDISITHNIAYSDHNLHSNTAYYVWKTGGSKVRDTITHAYNRAKWINKMGVSSGCWDDSQNCGGVHPTGWATNKCKDATINPAALGVIL